MYAVANLLEEGKFDEATRLSSKIAGARGKLESTLYLNSTRDSISRLDSRLPVALRTADFPELLRLASASSVRPNLTNLEFLRQRLIDFASAMDAVRAGRLAEAGQKSEHMDAELWRMSPRRSEIGPMKMMVAPKPAADVTPRPQRRGNWPLASR
jgi:hypothetical protein